MALVNMPDELSAVALTIMDGDFWSSLPFPDRGLHTLSHVGYTPHKSWMETGESDPYQVLAEYLKFNSSRGRFMIKDAARYVPAMRYAQQIDSLWEVKTVLVKNESNDGRPILLEKDELNSIWHVLGGKVDNIFDLLDKIETEILNVQDSIQVYG
jgi:hypothetical protein